MCMAGRPFGPTIKMHSKILRAILSGRHSQKRMSYIATDQSSDGIAKVIYKSKDGDTAKTFRKNWARLIQKIYEVDPLVCPKCSGTMKVIAFIERPDVIKKILKHLGL